MLIARLLPLAVLAVAACGQPAEPWVAADGSPPLVADVGDCHAEANRQAAARYPDQIRRDNGTAVRIEAAERFPAHVRFFEQCMKRKGFVRAIAPAK